MEDEASAWVWVRQTVQPIRAQLSNPPRRQKSSLSEYGIVREPSKVSLDLVESQASERSLDLREASREWGNMVGGMRKLFPPHLPPYRFPPKVVYYHPLPHLYLPYKFELPTVKTVGGVIWTDRQTDTQTHRHTHRHTDGRTDIVCIAGSKLPDLLRFARKSW